MIEIAVRHSPINDVDLYVNDTAAWAGRRARVRQRDFQNDPRKVGIPTLVLHFDVDGALLFASSGERARAATPGSELLRVLVGLPDGCAVSHAQGWDAARLQFVAK